MSEADGQDPSKIKMGTIDEEEGKASLQGTVILGIDPDAGQVLFFRDFSVEDFKGKLSAYLATDGNLNKSLELGELKSESGTFSLPIPMGTDTSPYNTVVLRDEKSKKKIATIEL